MRRESFPGAERRNEKCFFAKISLGAVQGEKKKENLPQTVVELLPWGTRKRLPALSRVDNASLKRGLEMGERIGRAVIVAFQLHGFVEHPECD